MQERSQGIRPTQFITTFGPGAILEGVNGPRIIPAFEHSSLFNKCQVEHYEIHDPALRQQLPEHSRLFRLPTNADLQIPESDSIFWTDEFPRWSLCVKHSTLYRYQIDSRRACPGCDPHTSKNLARQASRSQAISLLMGCQNGHMDDINWHRLVHLQSEAKPGCPKDQLWWESEGSALRNVTIRCPHCRASTNLGMEYLKEQSCSGRFPELRTLEKCTQKSKIMQRGAANLHVVEAVSSVTVPRLNSPLFTALQFDAIKLLVQGLQMSKSPNWIQMLRAVSASQPAGIAGPIQAATDEDIEAALQAIAEQSEELTPLLAKQLEFRELCRAAEAGADGRNDCFQVEPHLAKRVELGSGLAIRVTPVSRLRVVMAQKGYRRLSGSLVSRPFYHKHQHWYPAVELFGEGLFIKLDSGKAPVGGSVGQSWQALFEQNDDPLRHPGFVWWHSLSHRLIRALAIYSGYSAASVRERVYWHDDEGGLLLYAVQPGGDGTLGGLIALVSRFDQIVNEALSDLDQCSNDPFCEETPRNERSAPACYACLLVSETSCEHRNHSLDRLLLMESL
jgi:hypothetical protein